MYIYMYIVAFYSKPIQASSDLEVFEDVAHGLARHHLGWGTSDFLVEKWSFNPHQKLPLAKMLF